jgi:tetratricopeptide (TPR) repeat protein
MIAIMAAAAVALPCCAARSDAAERHESQTKAVEQQAPAATDPFHSHSLPPAQLGGPGLVICDPLQPVGAPEVGYFANGCTRWLQFNVGGQPQFGTTPYWSDLQRASYELGRSQPEDGLGDLRVTAEKAAQLVQIVGASHVVVGTVSGTPDRLTIRLSMIKLPERTPVGADLQITGSEADVLKQLPATAAELCHRLGVGSPALPPSVELDPKEITDIGRWSLVPGPNFPDVDAGLAAMASKSPLAALELMQSTNSGDYPLLIKTFDTLMRLAPANQYAISSAGMGRQWLPKESLSALEAAVLKWPDNMQFEDAAISFASNREIDAFINRLLVTAAKCPQTWEWRGRLFMSSSGIIRVGKFANQISQEEWKKLNTVYAGALECYRKAVAMDPQYAAGWVGIAEAACFSGDIQAADAAVWKAIELNPHSWGAFFRGLEMYQPKWYDDPDKLIKIAKLAAESDDAGEHLGEIASALHYGGRDDLARKLTDQILDHYRALVKQKPDYGPALKNLVMALDQTKLYKEEIPYVKQMSKLAPTNVFTHEWAALRLEFTGDAAGAEEELHEIERLDPHAYTYTIRANLLKMQGKLDEAIAVYRQIPPDTNGAWMVPYNIATVEWRQGKFDAARADLLTVLKKDPNYFNALELICQVDSRLEKADEAIQYGEHVDTLGQINAATCGALAYAYLVKKQWDTAVVDYRRALALNPNYPNYHANLGFALSQLGKNDEARTEMTWVISHAPNSPDATYAKKWLDSHPQ